MGILNSKCRRCGTRYPKGNSCPRCSNTLREQNRYYPEARPHSCPKTLPNGRTCGATVRGGVCPNANCG